jgi:hypothetical protein
VTDRDRGTVSRRAALQTAATLVTAGMAGRAFAQQASPAVQKVSQKAAQYQQTPKNGQSCSICVNFEPPHACKLVAGNIASNGWCLLFAPKPK